LHEKLIGFTQLETEMRAASDVQKSLLPLERPRLEYYEFWDYYESTRWVGGDSYDYLRVSRGDGAGDSEGGADWAITIADVAGKGLSAALFMARVATGIRYQFLQDRDPVRVVEALNRDLEDSRNPERFVTFALVMLDPEAHRVRVVNAGHWTPYIRRARTGAVERIMDDAVGYEPPLCAIPEWSYHAVERELEPGDMVFLVTDGVIEAFDAREKPYGEERLIRVIASGPVTANGTGMELIYDLRQHQGNAPQSDDIAIVCFRRIE
jgi:serine phosphatase RsbU (regulator of sigma subunit)